MMGRDLDCTLKSLSFVVFSKLWDAMSLCLLVFKVQATVLTSLEKSGHTTKMQDNINNGSVERGLPSFCKELIPLQRCHTTSVRMEGARSPGAT